MISKNDPKYRKKVGKWGELLAKKSLIKRGFVVFNENYQKNRGEIDIVAKKGKTIHFVEVKTVIRETISRFRPEEKVDARKIIKIKRAIRAFVNQYRLFEYELQIDLIVVIVDKKTKRVFIKNIENVTD